MENDIKKFYEQHKTLIWIIGIVVIGLIFIILFPLAIQFLIDRDSTHKGSDDGWLGFWGGYLGAIIGVAGALIAIQIQLYNEKKTRKSEQVDNTFFNLLNMFINQQNSLISEQNPERDIFENMLMKIWKGSSHAYRKEGIELFYSKKIELLSLIDKIIGASEAFIREKEALLSNEEKLIIDRVKSEGRSMSRPSDISNDSMIAVYGEIQRIYHINDFKSKIEEKQFLEMFLIESNDGGIAQISGYIGYIITFDEAELLDEDSKAFLTELNKDLNEYLKHRPSVELTNEKKRQVVEAAQESYRKQVGSYFRIFHRIIKYLNENVNDREIKKNYIGFLRANMNESQMAMIFYNINYTHRGSGAIEELKGTSFFGDKNELSDIESAHFFSGETLVWGNDDLKKMQEFC